MLRAYAQKIEYILEVSKLMGPINKGVLNLKKAEKPRVDCVYPQHLPPVQGGFATGLDGGGNNDPSMG